MGLFIGNTKINNINMFNSTITDAISQNTMPSGAITLGESVSSIGAYAFYYKPITKINAPEVLTVNAYCASSTVTEFNAPKLTTIGDNAFRSLGCTKLDLPNVTNVGTSAFQGNTSLITLNMINYQRNAANRAFGDYAVRDCSNLVNLILPNLTNGAFGGYAFSNCTSLKVFDCGVASGLAFNSLASCPLDTIILRNTTSIQTLNSSSVLNNSQAFKNGGTGGEIYIPQVMYNHLNDGTSLDYKASSN